MNTFNMSARTWVVWLVLSVLFFFIFAFGFRDSIWLALGGFALVLTVAGVAYLGRQSVRQSISLTRTLYRAHRALIRGDFAGAEKLYGRAIAQAESFGRNRDFHLGTALSHLGELYRTQGRFADAEPVILRAITHCEAAARQGGPVGAAASRSAFVVTSNLASLYINQGRFDEAEPLCEDVEASFKSDSKVGPFSRAVGLNNLGQVLVGQGRLDAAEALTRRAMMHLGDSVGRRLAAPAVVMAGLADLCRRQGRLDEAETLARKALESAEKSAFGPNHAVQSRFLNVMAEILRDRGRLEESEKLCLRSQMLTEKAFGHDHVRLDGCLGTLARIRVAQGRHQEAADLLERCLGILDKAVVPTHPDLLARRAEYAEELRFLGRGDEAAHWAQLAQDVPVLQPVAASSLVRKE